MHINSTVISKSFNHKFILLNGYKSIIKNTKVYSSNQYLIIDENKGVLLDPGSVSEISKTLSELLQHIEPEEIEAIFLSHQDPDVIGGLATWIDLCPCPIYLSKIWSEFLHHQDFHNEIRFRFIPDEGMEWVCPSNENFKLQLIPAYFLHSEGQINVYDPQTKVLFTGDIGSAISTEAHHGSNFVDDFDSHIKYIEAFHKRNMAGNKAILNWLETISTLDIEILAPQHGLMYRGQAVQDFLEWLKNLKCGMDLLQPFGKFN